MACLRRIFGNKKKQKSPPVEFTGKNLDDTEAELEKKQENLEKQIEECRTIAKKYAIENKTKAIRALQKKRRLEQNLEKVDHTLTRLEQQREALQNAETNTAVIQTMMRAGKELKRVNSKLDYNRVQTLMDKITVQHDVSNEISNAIRNSLISDVDEDELIKELEQLKDESLNEQTTTDNNSITNYPSIPTELDDSVIIAREQTFTDKNKTSSEAQHSRES